MFFFLPPKTIWTPSSFEHPLHACVIYPYWRSRKRWCAGWEINSRAFIVKTARKLCLTAQLWNAEFTGKGDANIRWEGRGGGKKEIRTGREQQKRAVLLFWEATTIFVASTSVLFCFFPSHPIWHHILRAPSSAPLLWCGERGGAARPVSFRMRCQWGQCRRRCCCCLAPLFPFWLSDSPCRTWIRPSRR